MNIQISDYLAEIVAERAEALGVTPETLIDEVLSREFTAQKIDRDEG